MAFRLSTGIWVSSAVVVLSSLVVADPLWARSVGVDVWNVPTLGVQVEEQDERRRQLDSESDDVKRHITIKESLVAELLAGRTTLDEVTGEFLALSENRPGYLLSIRSEFAGRTDREKVGRSVIAYAHGRTKPAEWDRVEQQLEADLVRMNDSAPRTAH